MEKFNLKKYLSDNRISNSKAAELLNIDVNKFYIYKSRNSLPIEKIELLTDSEYTLIPNSNQLIDIDSDDNLLTLIELLFDMSKEESNKLVDNFISRIENGKI